ncbi:MAG: hypothetical protein LBS95_01725 [Mycoplasmataceae bacterium]|jgi:cupin superfamily acireductone dioxygenase involved in methionine salvage|nr:hypothetical protein [Mycoplasmataceae bacterium]
MKTIKIIKYDNDKTRVGDEIAAVSAKSTNSKMPVWFEQWNKNVYEKNQNETNRRLDELKTSIDNVSNDLNNFKVKVREVFKRNNLK